MIKSIKKIVALADFLRQATGTFRERAESTKTEDSVALMEKAVLTTQLRGSAHVVM